MQGFFEAYTEMIVNRMIIIGIIIAICIAAVAGGVGYYLAQPRSFDAWLVEHEKTCPQCGSEYGYGLPSLCDEAFAKLQESLKK